MHIHISAHVIPINISISVLHFALHRYRYLTVLPVLLLPASQTSNQIE